MAGTVGSTGVVTGSLKTVWQARIEDLYKWLADPEISVRASVFAKSVVGSLLKMVELEEEDDWED